MLSVYMNDPSTFPLYGVPFEITHLASSFNIKSLKGEEQDKECFPEQQAKSPQDSVVFQLNEN